MQNNRHENKITVNHGISHVDACTMISILTNIVKGKFSEFKNATKLFKSLEVINLKINN